MTNAPLLSLLRPNIALTHISAEICVSACVSQGKKKCANLHVIQTYQYYPTILILRRSRQAFARLLRAPPPPVETNGGKIKMR